MAFLVQLAGSAVAVALLVALVAWAKIERDAPPLDEARARHLLADDFPDAAIEAVWTAPDGSRALARAGGDLLSVRKVGDGYVTAAERFPAGGLACMKEAFNPVTLATPFFVVAIVLEVVLARLGRVKARYERRDTLTSLSLGLGSTVAGVLTGGVVFAAMVWVWSHRLFTIPMTAWWAWVAIFLLEDLAYYVFHRLSHERRVWWASHVNHHSSQHYNLSTALRQTWTGGFALTWIVWLPLALLGFPPAMIAIEKGVSLVYQFWIHTEAVGRLPKPVEAVFNTPSHHRVHHARNPRYLDSNYAGVLIVWDRLFGTFIPEEAAEPPRYGLVHDLGDFNVLHAAFHEWAAIGRDLVTAKGWRARAGYLFGPPGWSPDGSRLTSRELQAKWRRRVDTATEPEQAAPPAA